MKVTVGILLFENAEELDFVGPWEVFASARLLTGGLDVVTIAEKEGPIRAAKGMQVIPDTGRRYAQTLGIRPFRTSSLTDAETNVRIGMAYFSDLLKQFGHVAPALAAYNAGEHRVVRWIAERPGIDRDEFVDDIPFPETQNYVKRIIGTAEDYRLLYPHLPAAGMRQSSR